MRKAFFIFFFTGLFFTIRVNAQHPDSVQLKQPSDATLEKKDSVYTGKYNDQAARDSIEKRDEEKLSPGNIILSDSAWCRSGVQQEILESSHNLRRPGDFSLCFFLQ